MGDSMKLLASMGAWLLNSGWFVVFEDVINGVISLVTLLIILVANLDKLKTKIHELLHPKNGSEGEE